MGQVGTHATTPSAREHRPTAQTAVAIGLAEHIQTRQRERLATAFYHARRHATANEHRDLDGLEQATRTGLITTNDALDLLAHLRRQQQTRSQAA